MAKKKQQRRRAKERRHEYEDVWVDAEGNELAPDEVEQVVSTAAPKASAAAKRSAPARGRGRIVQPPSWQRVGKRALIFAPVMFVTVYVISGKNRTLPGVFLQTLVLLLFFVPFSYAMDAVSYRTYQKRLAQAAKPKQKPKPE